MDNLPELRDIHLPEGVSVLPPAYGWWVILAGIILAVLLYHIFGIIRTKSKKLFALKMLDNINTTNEVEAARQMSEILRRICIFKYKNAAAYSGSEWIGFLNSKSKRKISEREAELLTDAMYMPQGAKKYDLEEINQLRNFCKRWIGENL